LAVSIKNVRGPKKEDPFGQKNIIEPVSSTYPYKNVLKNNYLEEIVDDGHYL
jgi:hypothetical protein